MKRWNLFFARTRLHRIAALASAALLSAALTAATIQSSSPKSGGWTLSASVPVSGSTLVQGPNNTWDVLENSGTIVELSASGAVQATWAAKAIALTVDGSNLVYVTKTASVDVFDPATGTVTASWPVSSQIQSGQSVLGMVVTPDGNTLYLDVAFPDGEYTQMVSVNLTNGQTSTDSSLTFAPLINVLNSDQQFLPNSTPALAVSADGSTVYNGEQLQTNSGAPAVAVYNSLLQSTQMMAMPERDSTAAVALSPGGNTLYVLSSITDNSVALINPATGTALSTIQIPGSVALSMSVDGTWLIVGTNTHVYIYNRKTQALMGTVASNQFQQIVQVVGNGNALGVLTTNGLYLYTNGTDGSSGSSGSGSGSTSSGSTGTTETVSLAAGWNLVDGLVGQAVSTDPSFYWNGTTYLTTGAPLSANAEWVYSAKATTTTVTVPSNVATSVTIAAKTWGMVGNPTALPATITLQAGDAAFTYDTSTQSYQATSGSTLTLNPGQGAWLYSAAGGTYSVGIAPPSPPSLNG